MFYILDEDNNLVNTTFYEHFMWRMDNAARICVALTESNNRGVSTVFLGMDHNFSDGPPLLFETAVFGEAGTTGIQRYSTYADALAGHAKAVKDFGYESK